MSDREPQSGDVYVRASGKLDDGVMETAQNVEWSESCARDPNHRFVCNQTEVLLLLRDNPAVVRMLDAVRSGEPFLLQVGEGEDRREIIGLPKGMRVERLKALHPLPEGIRSLRVNLLGFGEGYNWDAEVDQRGSHYGGDFATAVNAALESEG